MLHFAHKLEKAQQNRKSLLCVGLDPVPGRMPASLRPSDDPLRAVREFNAAIIEATHPFTSAYKINFAFYEALGVHGMEVIRDTCALIPEDIITIADAKRGDIGHSARFYAAFIFDELGFDSCTVSPYLGREGVEPFLSYDDKGTFVLARTSNPGSDAIQNFQQGDEPLFRHVASLVNGWDEELAGTAGLVAGATYPNDLAEIRTAAPHLPLLIPGIGAQGGNVSRVLEAAGQGPVLITSSRSIIYAGESDSMEEAASSSREAARSLLHRITEAQVSN